MRSLFVFTALLLALPAHAEVTIEWVTVGESGNACDTQSQGCFGAVAYTYQIGKYEVTNAQYAEFLNAVAATDTYGLYDTKMGSGWGGITRSGSSGSYTYSAIAGREDMPVIYVSFYDSLRFANWLHNGQPTGAQDSTTTEDGAYDMSLGSSVVRKAGAKVFLPSEDEWYKAAYYVGSGTYYDYPASSDTQTICATPGATANTANCDLAVGDLTAAGSYTGSASPSGSFDQGGNVWEWNEALIGSSRGLRGGSFYNFPYFLTAPNRDYCDPSYVYYGVGFRVARLVPALPVPSLSPVGMALLGGLVFGIGIVGMGLAARRRLS
jgi:formylglycine-generating enzyme required for sulfatase activity